MNASVPGRAAAEMAAAPPETLAQAGMRAMHVVHVNLAKGFRGGERQTELLVRHLATHTGLRQTLVCRPGSPLAQRLADVPVHVVHAAQMFLGHWSMPPADIVHAHEARAVHWAWMHRWLRGAPYLLTRRVDVPVRAHWFNRCTYRQAAVVVALSQAIALRVQAIRPGPVPCIPSAPADLPRDAARVAALRAQFGKAFLVGHVAALVDRVKGQRVVLAAARQLAARAPGMRFLFLGDGEDADALRQESADMPNVRWLGFRQDVGDCLGMLDAFVLPSHSEGLGSSILDAMQAGVPVVASAVGGIPDIVQDGVTGLLVPAGDAAALAQALLRLHDDPSLRETLARQAGDRLRDYLPDAMARGYLALYRQYGRT